MDLAAYLSKRPDLNQSRMAETLGITYAHMSRLVNRRSWPSAQLAHKIEKATGGKVTLKDLMPEEAA
jgi:DNA-binding transcriptional regulator YdaS (Cro superfamily)